MPHISLPKGGGAIRGMGEKFAANPITGTAAMTIAIGTPPARGFAPALALAYDSGFGNGPFGIGWNVSSASITRKTDRGLPQYQNAGESDTFLFSGAEDLVLVHKDDGSIFEEPRDGYTIRRYRPRIDGTFTRIERWMDAAGDVHWRSITGDNQTTLYGKTDESRIGDADDADRIFGWLPCESYDDKGNALLYEYVEETSDGIDPSNASERNRSAARRAVNRYIKRIKYGNRVSRLVAPELWIRGYPAQTLLYIVFMASMAESTNFC